MTIEKLSKLTKKISLLLLVAVLFAASLTSFTKVYGLNPLTSMWAIETNMDAGSTSQLWLAFKTSSSGGIPGTISIALTGGGSVYATQTPTTTGCAGATGAFNFLNAGAGATALPGTLAATGSTDTISLTGATTLTASTLYCVAFTGTTPVTNPSTAGIYSYTISDTQDTGTEYLTILSSGTNEAISLSASVPQIFTLTLGATSDSFPNSGVLSTSSVNTTSGVTATVSSNALSGAGLFAYDANTGLHSSTPSHTIASSSPNATAPTTITTAAEGYITNATYQSTTGGTALGITAPFTGTGATGDGLSPTPSEIASTTAPVNTSIIKIFESATITALTPGSTTYSDTIYIVGTGSF